jgi:RNA polymerase sigma-70 factor (ECF subfamily)
LRGWLQSEDILHSVVKDAFSDLARFEPRGPGSLEHYLRVCVLNKIRSKAEHYRAQKRAGEERLSVSVLDRLSRARNDAPGYIDSPRFERLERGLSTLPQSMREVVLLRTTEGMSNAQAAEVLGLTPAAASKAYNRALARLGNALQPPGSC